MLDDLIQTIDTLKERIRKHKDYLGTYEARTRVSLIDPMLRALGWDVDDPDQVQVEPKTDNGWADYALLGISHRPVAFVEAKKLSENIAAHTQQTIGYAISENMNGTNKISYCACTNGDDWKVFDLFTQAPVMDVSITGNDSAKAAMKFLGLWRRSLSGGKFNNANEPLFGLGVSLTAASSVTVAPSAATLLPLPSLPHAASRTSRASRSTSVATQPPTTGWTSLTGTFETTHAPPPSAIRLPDGKEIPLKIWRGVLIETALWLYRSSLLTRESCPIPSGKKRNLFSLDGLHTNGKRFIRPINLGATGIIMESNLSAMQIAELTRKLLQHFNQDPSKVLLRLP